MIAARLSPHDWSERLTAELGRPVHVRFGRARRHVIVAREEKGVLEVRMNAVFADAPEDVRQATATWLRSGRRAPRACERLDAWIASVQPQMDRTPRRRTSLRPQGEHHDLTELARGLFTEEFAEACFPLGRAPDLTWGRRPRRGARRTLLLGSFDPEVNLVRVHPVLDQAAVPRFFVRYILFHEILHSVEPAQRPQQGRAVHHTPEFRARERRYRDFERSIEWQERNLRALLRSVHTGRPMGLRASREDRAARSLTERLWAGVQGLLFPESDGGATTAGRSRQR